MVIIAMFFFFFLYAIPVFCHTFRSVVFQFLFLTSFAYPCFRWCDHHRCPFHLTFTDIHNNIYTPMGALPDGTRTRADLAVVVERPPPYRQPRGDIHTHSWPGGGSFLGKNPPPSVGFELTSIGTATSEYFLRQPCHRAIAMLMDYNSTRN
jgi:hypothetical protein